MILFHYNLSIYFSPNMLQSIAEDVFPISVSMARPNINPHRQWGHLVEKTMHRIKSVLDRTTANVREAAELRNYVRLIADMQGART